MIFFWLLMDLLISSTSYAKKNEVAQYNCEAKWSTLSEKNIEKSFKWRKEVSQTISETISFKMVTKDSLASIEITERFKNEPENFTRHFFYCDKNLNCVGKESKHYGGKVTAKPMIISPNGYSGVGSIDGKDYFNFKTQGDKNFEYQYIVYKDEQNRPYGLKVVCHE